MQKIIFLFLFCILCLTGCGARNEKDPDTVQLMPSETFQAEDPENQNLAGMLQDRACGVIVEIRSGQLLGSGVILGQEGEFLLIVTAAHVMKGEEQVQVKLIDGTVIEGEVVKIAENTDFGLIKISVRELSGDTLNVCRYAVTDKAAFDGLKSEDRILFMGSAEGVAVNAYEGRLTESWIYLEDYSQYMMLAKGYAMEGMSGGGVFDACGHFIGILSGMNEQGYLAILPLSVILAQL